MPRAATTRQPAADPQPEVQPEPAADPQPAADAERERKKLSVRKILAAINDGADDSEHTYTIAVLNQALYDFGAQDPSRELPRSWQRVQRRIGLDPEKPGDRFDGVATADEVGRFAARVGLTVTN